ncbi:MAG: class I SAM-dependent methyltransferase [Rubrivivax sp.]
MDAHHDEIYRQARCVDVAFGFRDIGAECDALASITAQHRGAAPRSVLELAAGPARHAREFARRGATAIALDASPAMCTYARDRAAADGVALEVHCADMVVFTLAHRVDLAWLAMDSASYLLDVDAVLAHLRCVADHLEAGGVYVLEMAHPRDVFNVGTSTRARWTAEADGLHVETAWGAVGDPFDPITQVEQVTVSLKWSHADGSGERVDRSRQRRCSATEFDALVRASGVFDIVEWRGAVAPATPAVPFDNDRRAWRMVPVLQRR